MKFINRLKYYVIGVGLGTLITMFFFRDRACGAWLPENRVKTAMLEYPLYTSNQMNCSMEEQNFTFDSLAKYIEEADIDFSQSSVEETPRIYYTSSNNRSLKIAVDFLDSIIYLHQFIGVEVSADCKSQTRFYDIKTGKVLKDYLKTK